MTNRTENNFIRSLFRKHYPQEEHVAHYNDLRTNGRRRIFKTSQHGGVATAWVKVLEDLQQSNYRDRWTVWESADTYQVGLKRYEER